MKLKTTTMILLLLAGTMITAAQSTDFTYQGKLNDAGVPANGSYDLQVTMFDQPSGGNVFGPITRTVQVTNGVFTVPLNFSGVLGGFYGPDRYLEIAVRPGGTSGDYQPLVGRQKITPAPYAIHAQHAGNSEALGGAPVNQFVQTGDSRLTDARPPTAGSGNYIQNQNAGVQPTSSFSISGNGTAGGTISGNIVNATTQLNINGVRAFTINGLFAVGDAHNSNVYAGEGAGINTIPHPALEVSDGKTNSFFGARAGTSNVTGFQNSFFGYRAGAANTARGNSFFGSSAGSGNIDGYNNSFFGNSAAFRTTSGFENLSLGRSSGTTNTTGSWNTTLGSRADVSINNLVNATAIGSKALVGSNNSLVLGSISGTNSCEPAEGCDSVNVGIGITNPVSRLHIVGGTDTSLTGGGYIVTGPINSTNISIDNNEIMARNNGSAAALALNAAGGNVNLIQSGIGNVGIGTSTPADKLHVDGIIRVASLGSAGSTALCRNSSNQISTCTGSPVSEPDTKLGRAVEEQRTQIQTLIEQGRMQQLLIEKLVQMVCRHDPENTLCKAAK